MTSDLDRESRPSAAASGVGARASQIEPIAWLPVSMVVLAVLGLLLANADRYGYHRDELYFRILATHPAWGYVDQPPLTPLLARAAIDVFGDSVWALRVPAALCTAGFVILTALAAREFGGGSRAQTLAALGAGFGAFPLITGHVLLTASLDLVVWAAVLLCVLRALLREQPRWWLVAGLIAGLSLYNKQLLVLLGVSLLGGFLIADRRRLRSRWLWVGMALALAVGAPNLAYQATHHWPQWTMAKAIAANKGSDDRTFLLPLQLVLFGIPLVPIWVAGLFGLWREARWRAAAAVGWAYPISLVVVFLTAGQGYYPFGLLAIAYAAGCVRTERWLTRPARHSLVWSAAAVSAVLGALVALPLLPLRTLGHTPIPAINQAQRDQIGWPTYVAEVAAVWRTLPPSDAKRTVLLAENYGEAGALARYANRFGLPAVYSGLNELWYRGRPPDTATVVIVVGIDDDHLLRASFAHCALAGALDNRVGVDNEEQGNPIRVCRDPAAGWAALWPRFQHYG